MAVDIFKIGSVELLVLLLLREQDAHGYQLAQLMEENSDGLLTVKTASLYRFYIDWLTPGAFPAKKRMWIVREMEQCDVPPVYVSYITLKLREN